jgi:hypothetical protein
MLYHQIFKNVPLGDPMCFSNGETSFQLYCHISDMGLSEEFNSSNGQREITLILLRVEPARKIIIVRKGMDVNEHEMLPH